MSQSSFMLTYAEDLFPKVIILNKILQSQPKINVPALSIMLYIPSKMSFELGSSRARELASSLASWV